MSSRTQTLVIDFGRLGHPLGQAINPKEVPELIEALRQRLACTAQELDISPQSLGRLELGLIALHGAVQAGQTQTDEEGTVRLIREVTAYLGQVLVGHLS